MLALLREELKRRWLEHVVSVAAIAAVTAAVLAQRTIALSAESAFHDLAHRLGANMLVLPGGLDPADFYRQNYGSASLPGDAEERLRASEAAEHLRTIAPRLFGHVDAAKGPLIVVGDAGRWPQADGGLEPAVAGTELARRLGLSEGSTLALPNGTVRVLGVAETAPAGLDEALFVPLPVAQSALGRPAQINALELGGCWCRIDIAALAKQVEQIIPGSRAITLAGMEAAQKGSVATVRRSSKISFAAGTGFVAVALAALTTAQVRRRRREIGLLLAIGASPRWVSSLFTVQAALAGAIGAAAGWALAWPLTRILSRHFLGLTLSPSIGMLVAAVAAGAVVAAVAAQIPAYLAASRDPTEVLHEP